MQRFPAPQLIKADPAPALIPPRAVDTSACLSSTAFIAGSRLASAVTVTLELENNAGQHVGAVLSNKSLREFFTAIKEGGDGALTEAEAVMWEQCGDVSSGGTPVSWVSSNGTAWQCGMRQYDIIVAIRGIDTTEMSANEVLNIFKEKQEQPFEIVVRRLDAEQQASLLSPSKSGPRLISAPASSSTSARPVDGPRLLPSAESQPRLAQPRPAAAAGGNRNPSPPRKIHPDSPSPSPPRSFHPDQPHRPSSSPSPPRKLPADKLVPAPPRRPPTPAQSPSPPRKLPPGQPVATPPRRPPTPPLHAPSPPRPPITNSPRRSPPTADSLRTSPPITHSPTRSRPQPSASPIGSVSPAGGIIGPSPSPEAPSPPRPTVPRVLQFKSVGPSNRSDLQQRLASSNPPEDPPLPNTTAVVKDRALLVQTEHLLGGLESQAQPSAARPDMHSPSKASVPVGERIAVLWEAVKDSEFYVTGSSATKGLYTIAAPPDANEQTKDFWVVRDGQCRLEVRWLPPVGSALGMFLLPMEAGYLNMHQVSAVPTDDLLGGSQLRLEPAEGSEYLGECMFLVERPPIKDPVSNRQAAKEYMLCCKDDNGPQRILAKLTAWLHAQTSFPEEMNGSILADSITIDTLIGLMYSIISLLTMETIRMSLASQPLPISSRNQPGLSRSGQAGQAARY